MNKTTHRNKEHYFNRFWFKRIFKNLTVHTKCIHDDEGAANTVRLWGKNHQSNIVYSWIKPNKIPSHVQKKHSEIIKKSKLKNH